MTIIFGTLLGLIPVTILLLIAFAIFSVIKKKSGEQIDEKPHAIDVTYYIGMFITLVSSLAALIGILFAAIDHKFKDVLEVATYYNELKVGDDVRISVAVLFVLFPIYLTLSWLLAKRIQKDADRVKLLIRSIYLYCILLVTSLTVAGNFVYIIYNFLSGEEAVRFIPKSLTLLVLAALTLGYHIYLLKRDYTKITKTPIVLLVLSIVLVVSSVVYGIIETGTPAQIRARKLDDKRIQDLSQIQSLVLQKWQKDGALPNTLAELNNELAGSIIAVDPKNKTPYEYKVVQQSELTTGPVSSNYPVVMYDKMPSATLTPDSQIARIGKIAKTDAIFEICGTFESERDVAKKTGQVVYTGKDVAMGMSTEASYPLNAQYYGQDFSNPTWDHKSERTCYMRTISIKQYQVYNQ